MAVYLFVYFFTSISIATALTAIFATGKIKDELCEVKRSEYKQARVELWCLSMVSAVIVVIAFIGYGK